MNRPVDDDALEIAKVAAMFAGQLGQVDQQTSSPVSQGGPQGKTQSKRINPETVYNSFAGKNLRDEKQSAPSQPNPEPAPQQSAPVTIPEPVPAPLPARAESAQMVSVPKDMLDELNDTLKLASTALKIYITLNKDKVKTNKK